MKEVRGETFADQATVDTDGTRFVECRFESAVLRYAGDFVPSWAGAISIDLLPVVLVLVLMVVHDGAVAGIVRAPGMSAFRIRSAQPWNMLLSSRIMGLTVLAE